MNTEVDFYIIKGLCCSSKTIYLIFSGAFLSPPELILNILKICTKAVYNTVLLL